jgi:hypothetical protein
MARVKIPMLRHRPKTLRCAVAGALETIIRKVEGHHLQRSAANFVRLVLASVTALAIAISMTGCGSDASHDFASRMLQAAGSDASAAAVPASLRQLQPSAMPSLTAADYPPITADQLFDWAEASFPQLFPARQQTLEWGTYRFRYYRDTDLYLAVEGGSRVVALGGPTGNRLVALGDLLDYRAAVIAASPLFSEVAGAFSAITSPFVQTRTEARALGLNINDTVGVGTWVAIDLDRDGASELMLILATMQPPGIQSVKVTDPVYARVFIYGFDRTTSKFRDRTADFIAGDTIIRAAPGAPLVVDLNNDGRPDVILAAHQEDGRNDATGSMMEARPVAILSTPGGKHQLMPFGEPGWNLGTPYIIPGPNGERVLGVNTGTAGWQGYSLDQGQLKPSGTAVPAGGGFMRTFQDRAGVRYLATTAFYPDVFTLRLLELGPGLNVVREDVARSPLTIAGTTEFTTWQGSTSTVNVVTDGSSHFIAGGGYGIHDACLIKPSPDAEPHLLAYADMLRILDYQPGVVPSQFENAKFYLYFRMQQGRLEPATLSIVGWETNLNSWALHCKDVNGDGYDDIWIEALRDGDQGTQPLLFLNDRQGSFRRVPRGGFVSYTTPQEQDNYAAILGDFDGDGLIDYVTIPSKGDGEMERDTLRLVRGLRRLD